MITWELIAALAVYNFIMYVTPGPNNSILTASGIKFGFIRSIPNIFGIPSGHGLQLALVCLGLGSLFITYPILYDILRYVGAGYILYLAYKMFGSLNISKTEDRSRPLKYYEAILFQFVNPKSIVVGLTAISIFIDVNNFLMDSLILTIVFFFMAIGSQTAWCVLGKYMRKFATSNRFIQNFNYTMSFLLIVCVILFYV